MTTSAFLRSFRLVCKPEARPRVEALLRSEGFAFEPEPFSAHARRLTFEPLPLGASLAARFGYIYIQDRSSMLPPLALDPAPGTAVLDMCASPGSKTGFLGQLTGPAGFVLGNEPSKNRLMTLRRNLQHLNLFGCCTCSHPGEALPLLPASWDAIQLDPPCSGWGTADKNPKVLELWQGDKVKPLIALQRRLLSKAAGLLAPGGRLVYSTCTTNVEENEDQLAYARDVLGLVVSCLPRPDGFSFAEPQRAGFDGVLRLNSSEDGQGFFVALLTKPEIGAAGQADQAPERARYESADDRDGADDLHFGHPGLGRNTPDPASGLADQGQQGQSQAAEGRSGLKGGFFVRPWEKESRFVGERRRQRPSRREEKRPEPLSREVMEEAYADPALLPDGDIAIYNGVAHFLPCQSGALLPPGFAWKGFALGKVGGAGGLRLNPHLRGLMPEPDQARARGLPVLDLEETAPLQDLLQGRSIPTECRNGEIGLYFRGLPLCRLQAKGGRALLPPS